MNGCFLTFAFTDERTGTHNNKKAREAAGFFAK